MGKAQIVFLKYNPKALIRIYYTSIYLVRNMKAISTKRRFYR